MRYPTERLTMQQSNPWSSNMSREAWCQMLGQLCQEQGPRAVFELCMEVCQQSGGAQQWGWQPWQQEQWAWMQTQNTWTPEARWSARRDMPELSRARGPKNWKRSDERMSDDCCEVIERLGMDAGDITVRVEKGECFLEGSCNSRKDRHLCEYVCEEVRGIVRVHNRLQVQGDEVHLANGKVSMTDKLKESVIS